MKDLKELQEMAKNGEISKEILEDENLKSELKKILKEENGVDVTDEQLPELLKGLENGLIGDPNQLEDVSGGRISGRSVARGTVGTLGFILGFGMGGVATHKASKKIVPGYGETVDKVNKLLKAHESGEQVTDTQEKALGIGAAISGWKNKGQIAAAGAMNFTGAMTGGALGAYGGVKLVDFIADKVAARRMKRS